MNPDDIITKVDSYFDSNESFHVVYSLGDVESVFREMEKFCADNDLHFEHDVESSDFEEPGEDEQIGLYFPIIGTDLQFEFVYVKEDGSYRIWCDADFYFDEEDSFEFDDTELDLEDDFN